MPVQSPQVSCIRQLLARRGPKRTEKMCGDLAAVGLGAMLDQIDRLPGTKEHAAGFDRNGEIDSGQHRLDMRGHVVRPLGRVQPMSALWRKPAQGCNQVCPHVWIGIFLDGERGGGVPNEQCQQAVGAKSAFQPCLQPRRDVEEAAAVRVDYEAAQSLRDSRIQCVSHNGVPFPSVSNSFHFSRSLRSMR